jgi:hypothetical protein
MFGTETWALTKRNKSLMQELDMKFLRSIEEITRRGRIRNGTFRDEIGIWSFLRDIENKLQ